MNFYPRLIHLQRLVAPLTVLIFPLIAIVFEFPEELPLWRSIAITTAWGGSGLLVASLLLMLREPKVAQLFGGLESMYRWHHRSGVLAYTLLLCHPLALALNGWTEDPLLAWQTLAPQQQSWPTWLGWIALILLMFGLTTTFIMRLPYRQWRIFHISLSLGVLLGFAHIYALLGVATLLLLFIFAATIILVWRFIIIDQGVAACPYHVTQVERLSGEMIEIRLAPDANSLTVSPGQFVLAAFYDGPNFQGCGEYHPFTISGIEEEGELRVSVKSLGPCSQRIQNIEPGVMVRLQGPFGVFLAENPTTPQLWVAGGIGITPFIASLRSGHCTQSTTLIYLFRNADDAAFLVELISLASLDPKLELLTHASERGFPDYHAILSRIESVSTREVYICGPAPMVDALMPHLLQLNSEPSAIHFEKFDFR